MPNRQYPALVAPNPGGGFVVTFRDIPDAIARVASPDDAHATAEDTLIAAMESCFEAGRRVPAASLARRGEVSIGLPKWIAAKIELRHLVAERLGGPADLARLASALGVGAGDVALLLDLRHETALDTLAAAFRALGHELETVARLS